MVRKFVYLCLLLASLGGYIMFDGMVLLAAACFLFLLAVVLLVSLQIQKQRFQVKAIAGNGANGGDLAVMGEQAEVSFRMKNGSIFPVARADVRIWYSDGSQRKKRTASVELKGRGKLQFACAVPSEHTGVWHVQADRILLYDVLQMFTCRIRPPKPVELYILPPLHRVGLEIGRHRADESEETDDTQKGDDPSVLWQIREYQPGDSLRAIHWKLSARTDQWMVREYGRSESRLRVELLLDLREENDPVRLDDFRTAAASVMYTLLQKQLTCQVYWTEGDGERRFEISSEEELYEALRALVVSGRNRSQTGAPDGSRQKRTETSGIRKIRQRLTESKKRQEAAEPRESVLEPGSGWQTPGAALCLDMDGTLWEGNRRLVRFPGSGDDGETWELLKIEL